MDPILEVGLLRHKSSLLHGQLVMNTDQLLFLLCSNPNGKRQGALHDATGNPFSGTELKQPRSLLKPNFRWGLNVASGMNANNIGRHAELPTKLSPMG